MGIEEYKEVLKLGEKEYAALTAKGEDPYLPVLEDILPATEIASRVNLGYMVIPIDSIVGTTNFGRSNAFSRSFYPLHPADSEFAVKWSNLYDNLAMEGMREGIIAFEYLGKYYAKEGNKRVSVSKLLETDYVEGSVTRLIPKKTDDPEILLNYEFIDFFNKTGYSEIYFSKLGSFGKLAELIAPGVEVWDEDTRSSLKTLFTRFRQAYKEFKGSEKINLTASDAFLTYISLLGFEDVKYKNSAAIKDDFPKIRSELVLEAQEERAVISSAPSEAKSRLFTKLFKYKKIKAAFVYHSAKETSSWCTQHEKAREYIDSVFRGDVTTEAFYNVSAENAEKVLKELCEKKYDVIFDTTALHTNACAKMAVLYPNVKILNCSLNDSTKNMRTYYLRSYESKFLLGMIAGTQTKTGHIYYVGDYAVYGTIASVNAFALGVRSVKPDATVHLAWTSAKDFNPEAEIKEKNCDVISGLDWYSPRNYTKDFGLYLVKDGVSLQLAAPSWNWGVLYENIINAIRAGAWVTEEASADKQSYSYWWGIASGAMDVALTNNIPAETYNLVSFLKSQLEKESYKPFTGKQRYQDKKDVDLDKLSALDLLNMHKLFDCIDGYVPGLDDISDKNAELTKFQGVKA